MRSALWRIFTLAFLVGLFHLSMHALDLFHNCQAFAATRAARQEPPAKPKRSRTSRIHLAPTALGLTTIQNLRRASSPRQNLRLVRLPSRLLLPSHLKDLLKYLSRPVHFNATSCSHWRILIGWSSMWCLP